MATWANQGFSFTYVERADRADPGASPIESFSRDGSKSTKIYDVDWDAPNGRVAAVHAILGWATSAGDATKIKRYRPMHDPEWIVNGTINSGGFGNAEPFLYAQSIDSIQGIGKPTNSTFTADGQAPHIIAGGIARYKKARLTINFAMTPYRIAADGDNGTPADESAWDRWVTLDYRISGQYLTIPRGVMYFVDGPTAVTGKPVAIHGLAPGKTIPLMDIRVTWHSVPYNCVPSIMVNRSGSEGALDTRMGKVNSATFNGFAEQTLLFTGASIRSFRHPLGPFYYDVEYTFSYNRNKHNWMPYLTAAQTFAWGEVTTTGATSPAGTDGKHIYDAATFAPLFRPPA